MPYKNNKKKAIDKRCNQNANVQLCSIPFSKKELPINTKAYSPVLATSIKRKNKYPNYCDLKIRMLMNRKEDSIQKANHSCLRTCLRDSTRFTAGAAAFFNLQTLMFDAIS